MYDDLAQTPRRVKHYFPTLGKPLFWNVILTCAPNNLSRVSPPGLQIDDSFADRALGVYE
jgi:hypothetical protein